MGTAHAKVLTDLFRRGRPRPSGWKPPPDAVEDPDNLAGAAEGGQVHGSARIAVVALAPVRHREPAVVDAFHRPAGLTGGHAEMADRLSGNKRGRGARYQCAAARHDV